MKKVGAREVGQCLNDNCFLGLDTDIALSGSPDIRQIARAAPNIAINKIINKNNKTPCIKLPKNATKKVCKLSSADPAPAECSFLELPVQLDGAASLMLIDSGTTHCFVQ